MYCVYLIRSINVPSKKYIGYTTNLRERLHKHNCAGFKHTTRFKPWELVLCIAFKDQDKAKAFEKYLKSGSGNAFAKRRLW